MRLKKDNSGYVKKTGRDNPARDDSDSMSSEKNSKDGTTDIDAGSDSVNHRDPKSFGFKLLLAIFITTIMTFPLFFFNFNTKKSIPARVTALTNHSVTGEDEERKDLGIGDNIITGTTIRTLPDSSATIRIANSSFVKIGCQSIVEFGELSPGKVSLTVKKGYVFIRNELPGNAESFEVKTQKMIARFKGTLFIESGEKTITVTLVEGSGRVLTRLENDKKREIVVTPGKSLNDDTPTIPIPMSDETVKRVLAMKEPKLPSPENEEAYLSIATRKTACSLFLDGKENGIFDRTISFITQPGKHTIRLEKKGYKPYVRDIGLSSGQRSTIDASLVKEAKESSQWQRNTLYEYVNPDDPARSGILGFAVSQDFIVAATQTSLICFDREGSLKWINAYGRQRKLFFDSLPVIFQNRVYASSNNKIVIIDADTGKESFADAPGIAGNGFRLVEYAGNILLSFPDGIYSFITRKQGLNPIAMIKFRGSTDPLVGDKGFYIASQVSHEVIFCDFNGNTVERSAVMGFCAAPPTAVGNSVIVGDSTGTVYQFDTDLHYKKAVGLPSSVCSVTTGSDSLLYVFGSDGILYIVDNKNFTIKNKLKIDSSADRALYVYKAVVCLNGIIFIGKDNGEMAIVNEEGGLTGIPLSSSAISTSAVAVDDTYYAGTKKGEIIRFE